MNTYPGNTSLADEVKRRIVGTYEQSLELAERGRSQEAILGCDFVLELDPQFSPARELRERLSGGGEASPVADGVAATPASGEESAEDLFDFDSLESFDVPGFDSQPDAGPSPGGTPDGAPGGAVVAAGDGLEARLRSRLEARDFQGVVEEATRERQAVASDPELARIARSAQSRLEAQPYMEGFLREAGTAIRGGDLERADTLLEKARSLDPDHPLLEGLDASLRSARGEPAPAPPAGEPVTAEEEVDLLDGFELPDDSSGSDEGLWDDQVPAGESAEDLFSLDVGEMGEMGEMEMEPPGGLPAPAPAPEPETPPEPAPPAAPEPAVAPAAPSGRAEGGGRIGELLAEGQRAADEGDYQGAIDAWSRIFLIDVDHEEAARRIEEARRAKAERERKVEEVFHEGLSALEAGRSDEAQERFERVLEMQPSHLAARDYLRQIESGEPVKVSRGPGPDETVAMGSLGTFDLSDLSGSDARAGGAAGDTLREEILVPPEPSEGGGAETVATARAAPASRKSKADRREAGRRSFVLVGGLVLLLVAAAGVWLFLNKDQVFPNSDAEEAAATAAPGSAAPSPIERATDLHERGQTAMALGLLKRIRPDDPAYQEAQELIASWETPTAPADEDAAETVPPEVQARRERMISAADSAYARGELLVASELYERAEQIAPLEGTAEGNRQAVERQLEPLSDEIELFELGEYDLLLPRLWRLYEEDPENQDVRHMLADSYYNRGVRELQRGNASAAVDEFEEALGVTPNDPELQRHFLFAQTYERRAKDLLYRIYVKYLPVR